MMRLKKINWKLVGVFFWTIINFSIGQSLTSPAEKFGYLNVNSNPMGLVIYLEGDSIGVTPIKNYQLKAGSYTISLFATDTIENRYWRFAQGNIVTKYTTLLELAKFGAGSQQVVIKPGQTSEVFFSLSKIKRAPTKLKIITAGCIGGGVTVAFVLGYLLASLTK